MPLFITLRVLGLVNTYWGLILVYMIVTLPLSVWMLTSYFKAIPVELEEAAIIDGASQIRVLFRITLPLSLPGLVAVIVYAFVTTWNEFIFALCFATDSSVKTLPIGLAEFSTEFSTDWGAVMAASVVMTLPIALLFLVFQNLFVGGLTAGATKELTADAYSGPIPQLGLSTFGAYAAGMQCQKRSSKPSRSATAISTPPRPTTPRGRSARRCAAPGVAPQRVVRHHKGSRYHARQV